MDEKAADHEKVRWVVVRTVVLRVICVTILAIISLIALFPLFFMFVTAFKGQAEFVVNQLGPPQSSLAAYAFARMHFRGRDALLNGIISLMVVPPVVMIIPLFVLMVNIHLVNTRFSVILVYVGILLPFSIYMLTSFFQTVPQEIIDAAIVDGCADFMIYWRIMLPLARPALSTLAIVNALFVWNELLVALILLQRNELKTLMVGLTAFKSRYNMDVPVTMAGLAIATIPLIVLYLVSQRQFIRGLVAGSLKE